MFSGRIFKLLFNRPKCDNYYRKRHAPGKGKQAKSYYFEIKSGNLVHDIERHRSNCIIW